MQYTADDIISALRRLENESQRKVLCRFFKTGKDEYGEGDKFLGIKVPQTREVVKHCKLCVSHPEIKKLLCSPWHEVRLCGFLLLVEEMKAVSSTRMTDIKEAAARRKEIIDFYLAHARYANNWDLVDLSCPYLLGKWLMHPLADGSMPSAEILDRLSESECLWEQRIAIVSTLELIRAGHFDETIRISRKLLRHPHDLIHKAVGWMLREMGKRDADRLRDFITENYNAMHRTTLRYAIEKFSYTERQYWLKYQRANDNGK